MSGQISIFGFFRQIFLFNTLVFSNLFLFIVEQSNGQAPEMDSRIHLAHQYPPPTPLWQADSLGNRRAVVKVDTDTEAVIALIEWHRSDTLYSDNAIYVVDKMTRSQVQNVFRNEITAARGKIVFEPVSGPGVYYIYYMPYRLAGSPNYPTAVYPKFTNKATSSWLEHWQDEDNIPRATSVEIESVDPFNAMSIMEQPMNEDEKTEFLNKLEHRSYYLFPADRAHPFILKTQLPISLTTTDEFNSFEGSARRGEYYAFQIGLYVPETSAELVEDIELEFDDLIDRFGNQLSKSVMSCLNTEGVAYDGGSFKKHINVSPGHFQPLWILINIPEDIVPGSYNGKITVNPGNQRAQTIDLQLEIMDEITEDHGVNSPWDQTRLTWLNSDLYQDNTVIPPYTPVKKNGNTLAILGREVVLDELGFPAQVKSFFNSGVTKIGDNALSLFSEPLHFKIRDQEGNTQIFNPEGLEYTQNESGKVAWKAIGTSGQLKMITEGSLEFDGFMNYTVQIIPTEVMKVKDIAMIISFTKVSSNYMLGLGQKGGHRPDELSWKWNVKEKNQDGGWFGAVNGGLQFSLRDQHYVRPLNTNFYLQKPLVEPISWANDGAGGIDIHDDGRVECYSGEQQLNPGDTLYFNFTLLITPFHTLNTDFQWSHRFFHSYQPIDTVKNYGANLINIHHANYINPYINYPYIAWKQMKSYVDSAHAEGLQVKIYNTVRELSNRAYETYPMRSLGHEVYSSGDGGGASWLQEHIRDDYIAAWFVPKFRDAAIINSGMNRWHNYYVEGMNWLVRNVGIDGIYLDDVAFDRITMKRIKRALTRNEHPGIIDLHSANQFNPRDGFNNSANLYMEHFPYLNRLWFGEYFDYENNEPDFYLTEVSGIPFGLMGEMLQDGGNPWRGMVYGMTNRLPWSHDADPRPLWKTWDDFGMEGTDMIGYWSEDCPVKPDHKTVKATVYQKEGKAMVALASWAENEVQVTLDINWDKLGMNKEEVKASIPFIRDFQEENRDWSVGQKLSVLRGKGIILILTEE